MKKIRGKAFIEKPHRYFSFPENLFTVSFFYLGISVNVFTIVTATKMNNYILFYRGTSFRRKTEFVSIARTLNHK